MSIMFRRAAKIVVALFVVATVVGCGDDNGSTAVTDGNPKAHPTVSPDATGLTPTPTPTPKPKPIPIPAPVPAITIVEGWPSAFGEGDPVIVTDGPKVQPLYGENPSTFRLLVTARQLDQYMKTHLDDIEKRFPDRRDDVIEIRKHVQRELADGMAAVDATINEMISKNERLKELNDGWESRRKPIKPLSELELELGLKNMQELWATSLPRDSQKGYILAHPIYTRNPAQEMIKGHWLATSEKHEGTLIAMAYPTSWKAHEVKPPITIGLTSEDGNGPIGCVVVIKKLPADEDAATSLAAMTLDKKIRSLASYPPGGKCLGIGRVTIADQLSYWAEMLGSSKGEGGRVFELKVLNIIVPWKNKLIIIQFSASPPQRETPHTASSLYERYAPLFQHMINEMNIFE